ncbi:MAG: Crp/Fnr family transcriptional regulator [Pyrinomonadaceae bacterium]|nr:Crp/Fnr family transcriptional regulator [Pyrinomonadaceae bacterium]
MEAFNTYSQTHNGSGASSGVFLHDFGGTETKADKKRGTGLFASAPVASSGNAVLGKLPAKIFDALKPHLRRVYVSKEQFLFQQDDELEYVYFPETAVISEFHILDDGRMVEVSITGKEGAIGISTLYHADRIANCVQVTQGGNVLRIESSLMRKVGKIYPELPLLLHSTLENYIRQISQKAVCNMYHSVEERFCTWLLMVHDRCGKDILKLTHEQIARTLGVYRPSVTCIALDMRKKRLIDYSRGGISIRDRDRMETIACGCYSELDDRFAVPEHVSAAL